MNGSLPSSRGPRYPRALLSSCPDDPRERDEAAEAFCRRLTKGRAHSFYFASRFLPPDSRRNVIALYAFCRVVDDIADGPPTDPARPPIQRLEDWRAWLLAGAPSESDLVRHALARVVAGTGLPLRPLIDLVESLIDDLAPRHLADLAALERYAHGVAGTVGSAMAYVLGAFDPEAQGPARALGVAMQMTNVLRDIGEDQARARVYLPADEMARVGYSRVDLARGVIDDRFIRLMRLLIGRARDLYAEGLAGIPLLPRPCRFPVAL
ncbi:MAG: phytoene/squalene synthase family protein, partial [Chloroflexota bacterium]